VIVHGGAIGIDRSFAEACGELGIEQETVECMIIRSQFA
jgi:hypothetical protein